MRALIISPQPFFTPRGTPFSVYYRTMVASELGVQVDLLTYGEGRDVEIPGVKIIRIPRFKSLGNVRVGPSFLKLFLDIFIFIKTVVLLFKNKYDFVHAHEEAVFFCNFLKPLFKFQLVYDMHSSLPQQLTNFKFTQLKVIINLFKKMEESCLREADAVITICPDLANYALGQIRNKEKHFLIENSIFDPVKLVYRKTNSKAATFDNLRSSEKMVKLPQGKKIVVYAGTLEPYQGIDMLLKAFKQVTEIVDDAFLLVLGGSIEQVDYFLSQSNKMFLDEHCLFTGQVSQEMAKYYCNRASVQVSPRIDGTNTPLKIYEQLSSDIPIVATNIYSHTQVLSSTVATMVETNPEAMSKGIIKALSQDKDVRQKIEKAKQLYREKYSRTQYRIKMQKMLAFLSVHSDLD
jgi:glycosyltransferase involved in cell wall biosynthesis